MADERQCNECGGKLPADAPQGLCPQCLMKLGLPSDAGAERRAASEEQRAVPASSPGGFVPPAPARLAEKFPQLEILELLGRGGMGAVYKARQKQLDRLVALKILPPEVGQAEAFAERFSREARSLARLNHPGIVSVFDFGRTEDGLYYFIMEFVDGTDLRHVIRAGELTSDQALAIVPQVCEALQYAHEEGIVHRDIKPENILLDKKGRVKIADFGLAKLLDRPQSANTLTQAGLRMGTPHYMAPEQIEGAHQVDHRADIYSLGVVFYEMLTGELPIGRFAPPSQKVQVDVRLDEIVLHTLEKEPERRYQHASEVKTDVETIASDSTSRPGHIQRVPTTRRFSRAAIVGACLAPAALFAVTHPGDKAIGCLFGSLEVLGSGISAGGVMLAVLGLVGFATPFATTILGFAAIAHIRNSAGRVYGMGLAVFDGLLFPLLVLDADIFVFLGLLALLARIPSVLPLPAVTFAALFVLPISGVVDFIVARWAWRKANTGSEPAQRQTGHGPSAPQRERLQQSGEIKADVETIFSTEHPAAAPNVAAEYNPMDKHVTIVAALNVGLGILGLMFAGIVFAAVVGGGRISQDPIAMRVTSIVGPVVSVFIAGTCIPGIIGGIGLFARRPWARILVIILGILNLLEVPFGTILGIYTIWVLVKKETVALFEHAQRSRQNQRGFPGPPTGVRKTAATPRTTSDVRDNVGSI